MLAARRREIDSAPVRPAEPAAAQRLRIRGSALLSAAAIVAASLPPASADVVYHGYLPFQGPGVGTTEPKIVTTGPFDETHTASNFFGTNTVRLVLRYNGGWSIRVLTYSDVQNFVLTGGNLQEVSGSISVSRKGQLSGDGPYPSALIFSGVLHGTVTVGQNSFHDGSLSLGDTSIPTLSDLFLPDQGVYAVNIPLSTTVPINSAGQYDVSFSFSSESWSRVDVTSGSFESTFTVTSVTLPDGELPETEGWTLSFDDGALSPNISAEFNGDGYVDGADLATWSTSFGAAGDAARADGDATLDKHVDGADLLVWQQQFDPAPAATAVPEPTGVESSLLLLLLLVIPALCRRPGSLALRNKSYGRLAESC
ncbi:MAG: hypothetical protein IT424_06125 [Pirellulales bacterium]|nr:hypothetical protein [Pirellulales bacterium]